MPTTLHIGGWPPGFNLGDPGHPTYILAELSANHNQDFEQAVRLIHAAKAAGADAIKLQTYTADTLTIACEAPQFQAAADLELGRHAVGRAHAAQPLPAGVYPLGVAAQAQGHRQRPGPGPLLHAL